MPASHQLGWNRWAGLKGQEDPGYATSKCKQVLCRAPKGLPRKQPLGWGCRGGPGVPQDSQALQLCALEGQVVVRGPPPVSIGDIQGMSRVLICITPITVLWAGVGARGGKEEGREREHEQQSCSVIALMTLRQDSQLLLAPRSWEAAQASSHLAVQSDPCLPRPFTL